VLITGPIWAKPAWGVWWTWEAKLTTTLILWLLLAGNLLSRAYAATSEQGARIGAVLGVIAALDVPVVYKAVDWWRGQHPIVFGPGRDNPLAPGMLSAFLVAMLAFALLVSLLLAARVRLAALSDRLEAAEEAAARTR
jgi:heme exporter protein C